MNGPKKPKDNSFWDQYENEIGEFSDDDYDDYEEDDNDGDWEGYEE